jgi:putative oxidoreductase
MSPLANEASPVGRVAGEFSLMGRVLLSVIFLTNGINKFVQYEQTVAYMEAHGMTLIPVFLVIAGGIEIAGAVALITGFHVRVAGAALLAMLVPVTLVFHDFWALTGMERVNQMNHFLKNLAIMGGLAYVVAFGAPKLSLDARRARKATGLREAFGSHPTHPIHGM